MILYLVQAPAPVYDVRIMPNQYTAHVTWRIRTAPNHSSYITNIIIYLNGASYKNNSREIQQMEFEGLKPNILYNVEIETQDGSFQKSIKMSKSFRTKEAGKSSQ